MTAGPAGAGPGAPAEAASVPAGPAAAPGGVTPGGQASAFVRHVARSSGWAITGYLLNSVAAIGVSVMVSRSLGPEGFGQYSYLYWILRTAAIVAGFGIPLGVSKFVSERAGDGDHTGARGIYRSAARLHLRIAPALLAVTAAIVWIEERDLALAGALAVGAISLTLMLTLEGAVVGLRRFSVLARNSVWISASQLALIGFGVWAGAGWREFLMLQSVAGLSAGLIWWASARRHFSGPTRTLERPEVRGLRRFVAATAVLPLIETVLWGRPELFFLERFASGREVGLYSVALVLGTLVSTIPLVASRVLLPEFSWLVGGKHTEALRRAFPIVCIGIGVIAIPLGIGGAIVARDVIETVYGRSFGPGSTAATIVMIGAVFVAIGGPAAAGTLTGPRPSTLVKATGAMAVINLAMDAALIPVFGIIGAAVATTAAQVVTVLILMQYLRRRLGLAYPVADLAKMAAAAAIATLAGQAAGSPLPQTAGLIVTVLIGGAGYVAAVHRMGLVSRIRLRGALHGIAPAEEPA